jgi:hypothetical protein
VTATFLLDTNVLSELMQEKPHPSLVRNANIYQDELTTTSTVWHELVFGTVRLPPQKGGFGWNAIFGTSSFHWYRSCLTVNASPSGTQEKERVSEV